VAPQAYRVGGDHSDPEPPGCLGVLMFLILCVLIGALALWLVLKAQGAL
jgi:hypothetical protein